MSANLFDGVLGQIAKFFEWISGTNYIPTQQYSYSKKTYNPLYGNPGQVDAPRLHKATNFSPPPVELYNLASPLEKHFVNTPLYKAAWLQQKQMNFNHPHWLLTPEFKGKANGGGQVVQERRIRWINGDNVTSRDPYQKRRPSTFYEKVKYQNDNQ